MLMTLEHLLAHSDLAAVQMLHSYPRHVRECEAFARSEYFYMDTFVLLSAWEKVDLPQLSG